VNHTLFPKEDRLPDCAIRDSQVKKGDRVEVVSLKTGLDFYIIAFNCSV